MLKLATKCIVQPQALEIAYQAGFRHVEIWTDAAVLADWQNVVRMACYYPASYVLHFPNRLEPKPDTLVNAVALYQGLGCDCMVIHQPMLTRYQEPLYRLDPNLRLAVENHKLTPEGFLGWAEGNRWLTLDVEHLWKYTLRDSSLDELLSQVRAFLARFADKLCHVHLPGYWPGFAEHRPQYCSREMVLGILTLLAEANFTGLVVSEVNPEYQNLPELRMDVLLFDAWRKPHDPTLVQ